MDNLRIAVLNKTAFVEVASELFPGTTIIKLNSIRDLFDGDKADVLNTPLRRAMP